MKENKKKLTIFTLLALLISVGLMSIAYLTKPTETLTNTFTVGKIDAEIEEPNYPEEDPEIIPGTFVAKDPTVTVKANSVDSYVYIAVKSYLVHGDPLVDAANYYHGAGTDPLDPGFSNLWTEVEIEVGLDYIMYIYRFNTTVAKSALDQEILPTLFTGVGFDQTLTAADLLAIAPQDSQVIKVKAFVHQVAGQTLGEVNDYVTNFFKDGTNW